MIGPLDMSFVGGSDAVHVPASEKKYPTPALVLAQQRVDRPSRSSTLPRRRRFES